MPHNQDAGFFDAMHVDALGDGFGTLRAVCRGGAAAGAS